MTRKPNHMDLRRARIRPPAHHRDYEFDAEGNLVLKSAETQDPRRSRRRPKDRT